MSSSTEIHLHSQIYQHTILCRCYERQDPFTWTFLLEKWKDHTTLLRYLEKKKKRITTSVLFIDDFKKGGWNTGMIIELANNLTYDLEQKAQK